MDRQYYKELSELVPLMEGEMIQSLYFYFKELRLQEDAEDPNRHNGIVIPTMEDIEDIQTHISNTFMIRHKNFLEQDLYREDWLNG